jgi:hypothetical protein
LALAVRLVRDGHLNQSLSERGIDNALSEMLVGLDSAELPRLLAGASLRMEFEQGVQPLLRELRFFI